MTESIEIIAGIYEGYVLGYRVQIDREEVRPFFRILIKISAQVSQIFRTNFQMFKFLVRLRANFTQGQLDRWQLAPNSLQVVELMIEYAFMIWNIEPK